MITTNKIKIKISFEYLSGNDNLLFFIKKIADKHKITGKLEKTDNVVNIYLSDDLEKIENFTEELGNRLPISIFLGEAKTIKIEQNIVKNEGFKIPDYLNKLPQNLSICPSCLNELFNQDSRKFYFPFISCNFCGSQYAYLYEYPFKREKTVFKFFNMCPSCEEETKNKESFRYEYPLNACHSCLTPIYLKKGENERYGFDSEKVAGALNTACGVLEKGNILRVYTSSGEKVVSLPIKENIQKIRQTLSIGDKPLTILITSPEILEKIAVISSAEVKALASIEKPVVYLQAKDFVEKGFIAKNEGFIKVKLPDEPILIMLSQYLKQKNIGYIIIEDITEEHQKSITDFELLADLPVINKQKDLEVFIVQGKPIIKDGEKGLFPNIIKSKPMKNLSIANDYAVLDLGDGEYLIDKKEKILFNLPDFVDNLNKVKILNWEYEEIKVPFKESKGFKAYEGAILSVLGEYNKLEEGAVGIYLSSKFNQDCIAVKTKEKPIKPAIKVRPIRIYNDFYKTIKWCLNEISAYSEEGNKLVKNFLQKNKELESRLKHLELEDKYKTKSSITAVFNVISTLIGVFQEEQLSYFDQPYKYLQTESLDFVGNQGLMIDFFLEEIDGNFYLNWIKTIQSIMSYKVAGVDNKLIAFSIFEGFGDYLIKEAERIGKKLKIENIVLSGDFFANPVLTGRIIKHFSGKKSILINRKLPIDTYNIAFGGIFV